MTDDLFDETCGGCFYFHSVPPSDPPVEGAENQGTCWRYPPTPLSIPVPAQSPIATPKGAHGAAQAVSQGIMTVPVRPPVQRDTLACGEWESVDGEGEGTGDIVEPATPGDAA